MAGGRKVHNSEARDADPHGNSEAQAPADIARIRGERLDAWLKEHGLTQAAFARLSGLSGPLLSQYLSGKADIGKMGPVKITALLSAMHVSDTWAWTFFQIPPESRGEWRSTRPAPMGPPADEDAHLTTHTITSAVAGAWMIMPPALITVDTNARSGLLLAQIGQQYWLAPQAALPDSAVILGQFRTAAPAAL
ncbi:helix-turn-helix domain-containing protein [Deinococcus soli (ex Cha et al. 2016)]|uniref:helix-turn-helix domain-containing protein n=1 Tax=Deinococcus soli (ex Cha et al. 2016) TaxID=1309411 RepID=UPI001663FF23|nr:helix-turn-helix transcriptional regulator [Deinococcus soli (ex Cha et al. 2016)]GGB69053.1 hypothetical protein GCM10008019_26590 [Deinococcus soli (ex Cha et al. 2016)]